MGFDIHITRAAHWCRSAGFEISSKEWTDFIAATSWLTFDESNGPFAAVWTSHPDPQVTAWFDWYDGNVYTTNPDAHLVEKMREIASALNAHLQDDDGKSVEEPSSDRLSWVAESRSL